MAFKFETANERWKHYKESVFGPEGFDIPRDYELTNSDPKLIKFIDRFSDYVSGNVGDLTLPYGTKTPEYLFEMAYRDLREQGYDAQTASNAARQAVTKGIKRKHDPQLKHRSWTMPENDERWPKPTA